VQVNKPYKAELNTVKTRRLLSAFLCNQCSRNLDSSTIMALNNISSAINATMRAVLWEGNAYNVIVADVPRPTIINATDAIVKLSRAAIYGLDLHIDLHQYQSTVSLVRCKFSICLGEEINTETHSMLINAN